jgi:hypothetical protein
MKKIQKIYENVSLRYIINSINNGVTGISKLNDVLIISDNKPGIFIKNITIDISNILSNQFLDISILEKAQEIEIDFNTFIVFTINDEEKLLMNCSLLEYILMNDTENNEEISFLDKEIWYLLELNSDELTEINNEKINTELLNK